MIEDECAWFNFGINADEKEFAAFEFKQLYKSGYRDPAKNYKYISL